MAAQDGLQGVGKGRTEARQHTIHSSLNLGRVRSRLRSRLGVLPLTSTLSLFHPSKRETLADHFCHRSHSNLVTHQPRTAPSHPVIATKPDLIIHGRLSPDAKDGSGHASFRYRRHYDATTICSATITPFAA